jgi:methyl-accepting chemotaxis protein
MADNLSGSLTRVLKSQLHIARSLAPSFSSFGGMDIRFYGGPSIDELTETRLNKVLHKALTDLGGGYHDIFISDHNGFVFAGTDHGAKKSLKGRKIDQSPIFKQVTGTKEAALSQVIPPAGGAPAVITAAAPIYDKRGNLAGLLGFSHEAGQFG